MTNLNPCSECGAEPVRNYCASRYTIGCPEHCNSISAETFDGSTAAWNAFNRREPEIGKPLLLVVALMAVATLFGVIITRALS